LAAGGYAGDAEGDAALFLEFGGAVVEQADQGPVDVAEAEEGQVEFRDGMLLSLG